MICDNGIKSFRMLARTAFDANVAALHLAQNRTPLAALGGLTTVLLAFGAHLTHATLLPTSASN